MNPNPIQTGLPVIPPAAPAVAPAVTPAIPTTETPEVGPESSPQDLIAWAVDHFRDLPMVMTTAFGMEGCALIDMMSRHVKRLTVGYIDTGFFFPETHQLRQKLERRYPQLEFACWSPSISVQQQAASYGPELWKNNPNLCCHIRKVVPMNENIRNYRFWVTGVRRTQTQHRAMTDVLSWDWKYRVLKFCPLAGWTRSQVWDYIQKHDVPFNQLHLQEYPSIGCFHCTKPVPGSSPDADSREGRWQGTEKTECGLHYSI